MTVILIVTDDEKIFSHDLESIIKQNNPSNNSSNNNTDNNKRISDFRLDDQTELESTKRNERKLTCGYFALLTDHGAKIMDSENYSEYLDLARELKLLWNMRVIMIRGKFNKFPDFFFFFAQAFKIVVDSWKFTMLLLYILWDDWPIFMISASNEQLQQQLEYTLLKPDYHSWWVSKMQSGRVDTLEKRYARKFCFKLGKKCHWNVWNDSDCFWSILHESSMSFSVA